MATKTPETPVVVVDAASLARFAEADDAPRIDEPFIPEEGAVSEREIGANASVLDEAPFRDSLDSAVGDLLEDLDVNGDEALVVPAVFADAGIEDGGVSAEEVWPDELFENAESLALVLKEREVIGKELRCVLMASEDAHTCR